MKRDILLDGCLPEPMLYYLKSLGILRLVAEQKDPEVCGYWAAGSFALRTTLDIEEIYDFFLNEYQPTPIITPWNGGSGFWGNKTVASTLKSVSNSTHPRLALYRRAIVRAKKSLNIINQQEKPTNKEKPRFLRIMRSTLPDQAVLWIDALCAITEDRVTFAPLLGTGGNDGNMEFSNNFMQRLADVMPFDIEGWEKGGRKSKDSASLSHTWLENSLMGGTTSLISASIGQFHPGGIGGPNSTQGFEGNSVLNPWDYILMVEGSLLLAGSVVRRFGRNTGKKAAFPFTVRPSPAGWQTCVHADAASARQEIWMPLWDRPALLPEIAHLLAEGRAQVGKRPAVNGTDFARAVVSLGVDRGLSGFSRFAFLKRKGEGYISAPLGYLPVKVRPDVRLFEEADPWLDRFRRMARRDESAESIKRALKAVDDAIFKYCQDGKTWSLQNVLISLAEAEDVVAHSRSSKENINPLPPLSLRWLTACDDGSAEYRLALAVASLHPLSLHTNSTNVVLPMRAYLKPVREEMPGRLSWHDKNTTAVWGKGDLTRNLLAVLERRCLDAQRGGVRYPVPTEGYIPARLADIHQFLNGEIDEIRIVGLIKGLALLRWPTKPGYIFSKTSKQAGSMPPDISRAYALCKLLFHHRPLPLPGDSLGLKILPEIAILPRLKNGDCDAVARIAARRIKASGLNLLGTSGSRGQGRLPELLFTQGLGSRIAAALLFPVEDFEVSKLMKLVLRNPESKKDQE